VREVSDKYAHKHFDHTIRIAFSHNEKWNLTQLEVSAIDKQGVYCCVVTEVSVARKSQNLRELYRLFSAQQHYFSYSW
jgi:NADPH-dependent 7-cyano-7-deazaguanine reductase QueF-like protein